MRLRYRDGKHGAHGGAERTDWETLLEMERFDYRAGEMEIALVLNLAKASERAGQSPSCLGLGDALHSLMEDVACFTRVLCGYFEHQRRVRFVGASRSRPDHHGHLPGA